MIYKLINIGFIKKKYYLSLVMVIYAFNPITTFAGSLDGGPYVVWVNLEKSSKVDSVVHDYLNQSERDCFFVEDNPILYMKDRPKGITNALVERAVIKNDANSLIKLNRLLTSYIGDKESFGEYATPDSSGLDGVIIYSSKPEPRFISVTTQRRHRSKIKTYRISSINDSAAIVKAFCNAVPPITRSP